MKIKCFKFDLILIIVNLNSKKLKYNFFVCVSGWERGGRYVGKGGELQIPNLHSK